MALYGWLGWVRGLQRLRHLDVVWRLRTEGERRLCRGEGADTEAAAAPAMGACDGYPGRHGDGELASCTAMRRCGGVVAPASKLSTPSPLAPRSLAPASQKKLPVGSSILLFTLPQTRQQPRKQSPWVSRRKSTIARSARGRRAMAWEMSRPRARTSTGMLRLASSLRPRLSCTDSFLVTQRRSSFSSASPMARLSVMLRGMSPRPLSTRTATSPSPAWSPTGSGSTTRE